MRRKALRTLQKVYEYLLSRILRIYRERVKKLKAELKELEEGKTAEEDGETKEKLAELYQLASSYYSIKDMLVQCCHFFIILLTFCLGNEHYLITCLTHGKTFTRIFQP